MWPIAFIGDHLLAALLALLFAILVLKSPAFAYYAKMTAFGVGSFLMATVLPLPMFVVRFGHYRNALGPALGCRILLRLLGVRFSVRGAQNIRRDHGSIVLINHQSFIDLGVLSHLWPIVGRATVVAKRLVLFFFPPCYGWGTLFIDRADRSDALGKLNAQVHAIESKAAKLLVFPEGTRGGQTAHLLPFKKGPFHIAVQAQAPIQPVVVSRYTFLNGGQSKRFGRGQSIISILPEIETKGLIKDDVNELLARTQLIMQTEYDRINAELLALTDSKAE